MTPRRVVVAAALAWTARWAAMQLAAYAGHRWPARRTRGVDPSRRPGWMPGPFDR